MFSQQARLLVVVDDEPQRTILLGDELGQRTQRTRFRAGPKLDLDRQRADFFRQDQIDFGAAAPMLRILVGSAAVMVGLALLWRKPACATAGTAKSPLRRFDPGAEPRPLPPGGLFLMGLSMALTPCAPLGVVLFSAASSANSWEPGDRASKP